MAEKNKMDFNLIQPFINATLTVLKTMAFTEAHSKSSYLKDEKTANGDVSGVIGLTGDASGSLSVSFPEKTILTIVSNMFGERMSEVDDEIKDAVGEITNMISGQARQELEGLGMSLESAIPTVISGKDHTIKHITTYPILAITFSLDEGEFLSGQSEEFTIEVCIEEG
jgi:chemotaxis protein CheX